MVDALGYPQFFVASALIGIPVALLCLALAALGEGREEAAAPPRRKRKPWRPRLDAVTRFPAPAGGDGGGRTGIGTRARPADPGHVRRSFRNLPAASVLLLPTGERPRPDEAFQTTRSQRHCQEILDVNSIALSGETLPVPVAPTAAAPLSEADRAALRRAVDVLERPGLAARLSAAAGAPLDMIAGRSRPPSPRRWAVRRRPRCGRPCGSR